jgi:hypothetical protein
MTQETAERSPAPPPLGGHQDHAPGIFRYNESWSTPGGNAIRWAVIGNDMSLVQHP